MLSKVMKRCGIVKMILASDINPRECQNFLEDSVLDRIWRAAKRVEQVIPTLGFLIDVNLAISHIFAHPGEDQTFVGLSCLPIVFEQHFGDFDIVL